MQFTPDVGPEPRLDISGKEVPEPITRAIEVTLSTLIFFLNYDHLYIHLFNHLVHPSIAHAIAASKCFASRHEVVVVSFNMNGDRPRLEGWPTKGSRPPRVKQSQGRKT